MILTTENVFSLLDWLRSRCDRYGVENIDSLLSFIQGYCLGTGANYPAFAEILYDSAKEYFALESQLLPATAIRVQSPSISCEIAYFYAWLDWLLRDEIEVLAEALLSDEDAAIFREKQASYHSGNASLVVPAAKSIYLCEFKSKYVGAIFLDRNNRRFFELIFPPQARTVERVDEYVGTKLNWKKSGRTVGCGIFGSVVERGKADAQ